MNDRFKFRAWDKKRNKIYNPKAGDTLEYGMEYANLSIGLNMDDLDVEDRWCLENEDLVLMQSTGLKDKNGKLIYEGDIVKYHYTNNNNGNAKIQIGEIKFTNERGQQDVAMFRVGDDDIPCFKNWIEIIGNIYENPELLATNKPI